VKRWTNSGTDSYPGGLVFANGHIHLVGEMHNDTLDRDLVIYKYNAAGTQQWHQHYNVDPSGSYDVPLHATADAVGNIYISLAIQRPEGK
jgi:hypothetical protein